jgi:hypothetical protein
MYKRKQYKKLQTKNESFLDVTSLRNNGSPEAGVSCLIHSGAQHLLVFSLPHAFLRFGISSLYVSRGWKLGGYKT